MTLTLYLVAKSLHLIGMVCWFAGLFYLPRLFVYHHASEDTVSRERFELMEGKLYRIIMNPAMMVTVTFGLVMVALRFDALITAGWLWLKILFVAALIGFHIHCKRLMAALANNSFDGSDKHLRLLNEVPVLPLVAIVLLAVFRPFA